MSTIDRAQLLRVLTTASVGTTKKELIEQSNCFIFTQEHIISFTGEILTRCTNPLPHIRGAIPAEEMVEMLAKLPDEQVGISLRDNEIRIKGAKREVGITCMKNVQLPYSEVPRPHRFETIEDPLMGTLLQAARVCGRDETKPMTTTVHITGAGCVEACDNYRLFRSILPPSGSGDVLIPASSVEAIGGLILTHMAVRKGWIHFCNKYDHVVSLRCVEGDYPDLSGFLKMKDPHKVRLPSNLSDILSRAEVMQDSGFDAMVSVEIASGALTLKARSDSGWYRESKSIKYDGSPLRFQVNPTFLSEVISKSNKVTISGKGDRLKIESGETIFVVALEVPE